MPLSGAGLCEALIMTPKSALEVADEERRRGGRDDPGVEHVDAGAGEPGRDGGGEELARDAGVAREDGDGSPPLGAAGIGVMPLA